MEMKTKTASSAAKAAAAAAAASLAETLSHHHPGLFTSPNAAHHLAAAYPGGPGTTGTASSAAQQILNYAAQLSGKGGGLESNSGPGGPHWDPAVALQMSQLFGTAPGSSAAATANPETLAQLNAASQLIAASLLQSSQKTESQSLIDAAVASSRSHSSKSSKPTTSGPNTTSTSQQLLCSICGQVSRDPSDYEAHLMTHISLLSASANQNAYQYSLNLLRMQNLFNGGSNSATTTPAALPGSTVPNGTGVSASASTAAASTHFNKKRKLLAASQHDSFDLQQQETEKKTRSSENGSGGAGNSYGSSSDFDSLSRLGLEQLLKGSASADTTPSSGDPSNNLLTSQQAQSLLSQLAAQAKCTASSGLCSPTSCSMTTTPAASSSATSTTTSSTISTAFPCTSCHKTFATEVDLKAHLIRHLTQHPYVCVSCGKGFKYEHSLNFHIKSYHSGGGSGNKGGGSSSPEKAGKGGKDGELKLSKKSRNNAHVEDETTEALEVPKTTTTTHLAIPTTTSTSLLHSRLTLMDENHNASGTLAPSTGKNFTSELSYFFGKPPTNLPTDSPIQIRSEKLLISALDAVNVATDQSIILYKCCLCCVAFASLDQMAIHVANVHPNATASSGGPGGPPDLGQLLGGLTGTAHHQQLLNCDKCTAKFTGSLEYEMHMQLHRTLEVQAAQAAASGAGSTAVAAPTSLHSSAMQYPFNLLSHLTGSSALPGSSPYPNGPPNSNPNGPATVDFRQLLANAKDTDFGRKFAAQLLQDSTKDLLDPYASHHHRGNSGGPGAFHDRCSPPTTPASAKMSTSSSDNNNNSLLYLSLLPDQHKVAQATSAGRSGGVFGAKVDSTSTTASTASAILNLSAEKSSGIGPTILSGASTPEKPQPPLKKSRTTGSSDSSDRKSSSAGSSNGASMRHIKEPVDIFEGAGQSLPIQKFPLGDIEETAPGQFKCRFCDKTFDRVFSVHRHERVHTGFKPCICKTCGRGFSEKRNLRHHIIRFHSDGSGRELLKRKRKPKNGVLNGSPGGVLGDNLGADGSTSMGLLRNESFMSSLLGGGRGPGTRGQQISESLFNAFRAQTSITSTLNGASHPGSLSNLKMSLAELDSLKYEPNSTTTSALGDAMNLSGAGGRQPNGSSRRRKGSKPSRKVYEEEEEDDDDEDTGNRKEMLVVDVDVVPCEEDDDGEDDSEDVEDSEDDLEDEEEGGETEEHEESEDQTEGKRKQSVTGTSEKSEPKQTTTTSDGDETEEEEVDAEVEVNRNGSLKKEHENHEKSKVQTDNLSTKEKTEETEEASKDVEHDDQNKEQRPKDIKEPEENSEEESEISATSPRKATHQPAKTRPNRRFKRKSK